MVVIPNYTGHRKDVPTLKDYFTIWKLMRVYPHKILELGIDAGGSLLLWNDMFAPDSIVGLDVNIDHEGLSRLDDFPNIQICCFDQTNIATLHDALDKLDGMHTLGGVSISIANFDLIIDDCLHNIDGIMNSMYILWPRLNPGGAYIIEDWNEPSNGDYAKVLSHQCLDKLDYWRNVSSVTVTGSLIGLVKDG